MMHQPTDILIAAILLIPSVNKQRENPENPASMTYVQIKTARFSNWKLNNNYVQSKMN